MTGMANGALTRAGTIWATTLLACVYFLAAIDRNILAVLLVPIQKDLHVSDTAMGALTGTAFAMVYATAALPLARLADRTNRRNLLAAAVAFWSAMTMLCGTANSYIYLLLARIGVAAGESGANPATSSMVGDLFPSHRRGTALSVIYAGSAAGYSVGAVIAGVLNDLYNWQIALMAVGAPGLLLAALIMLTTKEPVRGLHDGGFDQGVATETTIASLRRIWAIPTFLPLLLGMIFVNIAFLGWLTWLPTYLIRIHHLGTKEMSAIFGIVVGVGGVIGGLIGGSLSDRLARAGARFRMYYCSISILIAIFPLIAGLLLDATLPAIVLLSIYSVIAAGLSSVTNAAMLSIARPTMRGFMTALIGLAVTVFGGGVGPFLIGAANDALASTFGDAAIRYTMLATPVTLLLAAGFFYRASRTADRDAAVASGQMQAAA